MRFVGLFALLLLVAPACRPPQEFDADKVVTESDSGSTINLHVGDKVVVRLSSNDSTGFRWQMESGSPSVLGPNGAPKSYGSNSTAPGNGGTVDMPFLAKAEGRCELKLVFRRQLETEIARRWSATFIVTK